MKQIPQIDSFPDDSNENFRIFIDYKGEACESLQRLSLKVGEICPYCRQGIIQYNGLLNLECPICGMTEAGACT